MTFEVSYSPKAGWTPAVCEDCMAAASDRAETERSIFEVRRRRERCWGLPSKPWNDVWKLYCTCCSWRANIVFGSRPKPWDGVWKLYYYCTCLRVAEASIGVEAPSEGGGPRGFGCAAVRRPATPFPAAGSVTPEYGSPRDNKTTTTLPHRSMV